MKSNFIKIQNQQVAYYDNQLQAQPVLFIHGNSLSAKTWKRQFEDKQLNENYRLIALDLPGHGKSEWAKEPEKIYSFPGLVSELLKFIEALNLQQAVFVAHSLGGNMIIDAIKELPTAKGFMIFGAPPIAIPPQMEKYFLPNPVFPLAYKPDLTEEEIKALASAFINSKDELYRVENDIKKTDPKMRAYLGASIKPENFSDQVKVIEKLEKPIAIFHGEDDPLVNGEYFKELNIPTLWKNQVQIISNSGHSPQLENPEEFNFKIKTFLDQICQN